MALDSATLNLAGGIITFFSGVFLLAVWSHDRRALPALWWAAGNGLLGTGIVLAGLHATLPFAISNVTAPILLNLSAPCAFIAARHFNRGTFRLIPLAAGVAVWLGSVALTGVLAGEQFGAALGAGFASCFYAAAASEFWFGRGEELRGRIPIVSVVTTYAAALFLLAVQFAVTPSYVPVASIGWLGVQFVGLVYALGVALFLIMMLSDRREKTYRAAALTDPLTGLPNRRAFLDRAQRMLDRQAQNGDPVALLAFDLDGFKAINDTFGHAMGDHVLHIFGDVLSGVSRPTDLLARMGGEEFVALLPNTDGQAAVAIANRVRDAFQRVALFVDGQRIGATVSVGVAAPADQLGTVLDILPQADIALYRAKNEGRNRVVLACAEPTTASIGNVVRIA